MSSPSSGISWNEFKTLRPELADFGQKLLYQFGLGLGFIATVRKDGGPRLHPVCPLLYQDHLYVFILGNSPKRYDLVRDSRYALHTFPPANNDDEFYCTGTAHTTSDSALREAIASQAKHNVRETEVLFELYLERVLYATWKNPRQPNTRPIHTKWSVIEV